MSELDLASELYELIERRKEIERKEAKLKEHFKTRLSQNQNTLMVGRYLFSIAERSRTDLDKEKLRSELGQRYGEFEKVSSYNVLDLKLIA